jgi:hypothetical protein
MSGHLRTLCSSAIFAVDIRSESDHSCAAEREMADKRMDYFAADTLVVWDAAGMKRANPGPRVRGDS